MLGKQMPYRPTGLPAHPPPCHLPLPPRAQTGAPGRAGHPDAAAHSPGDEDRKPQLALALNQRALAVQFCLLRLAIGAVLTQGTNVATRVVRYADRDAEINEGKE